MLFVKSAGVVGAVSMVSLGAASANSFDAVEDDLFAGSSTLELSEKPMSARELGEARGGFSFGGFEFSIGVEVLPPMVDPLPNGPFGDSGGPFGDSGGPFGDSGGPFGDNGGPFGGNNGGGNSNAPAAPSSQQAVSTPPAFEPVSSSAPEAPAPETQIAAITPNEVPSSSAALPQVAPAPAVTQASSATTTTPAQTLDTPAPAPQQVASTPAPSTASTPAPQQQTTPPPASSGSVTSVSNGQPSASNTNGGSSTTPPPSSPSTGDSVDVGAPLTTSNPTPSLVEAEGNTTQDTSSSKTQEVFSDLTDQPPAVVAGIEKAQQLATDAQTKQGAASGVSQTVSTNGLSTVINNSLNNVRITQVKNLNVGVSGYSFVMGVRRANAVTSQAVTHSFFLNGLN